MAPVLAASQAAPSPEIYRLINQLFAGQDKGAVFKSFAQIQNQAARGETAEVQASLADFVALLMLARDEGRLLDPNGSEPPTITEALRDLVNAVATFGGVSPTVHGILAVGNFHACVIEANGQTACWGSRSFAQLGDGTPPSGTVSARVAVAGSPAFTQIISRGSHTCGTTVTGEILCWGRNDFGMVTANGTQTGGVPTPTQVGGGPYRMVSPARLTSCGLTTANAAFCWGRNQAGELGDGTTIVRLVPVPVSTGLQFSSIEASWIHTCALTFVGAAHCWGDWQGQAVLLPIDLTPVSVPGGHVFARLYSGGTHTCGLTLNDEAWCWGDNTSGQLGDGTTVGGGTPVQVSGVGFFAMMAAGTTPNSGGRSHTCGLSTIGRILCWGLNDQGQLGDGTTIDRLAPAPILSNDVFVAVGAGDRFTCALTPDQRVFCWGTNGSGELGTGAAGGFSAVPVLVP
jgi:alpha-tubulin suppressor-like RCC1 family protein